MYSVRMVLFLALLFKVVKHVDAKITTMKKVLIIWALLFQVIWIQAQQLLSLKEIQDSITMQHPYVKMYDAEIQSMDAAAEGAGSWMPPEISSGLWMTPYNPSLWKKGDMGATGMGAYMIGGQQMFPNKKKQQADISFMQAMSSVEKEKKKATLNELIQEAKFYYYEWLILKKKILVLKENEKLLDFMIKNAEIRYKNGLGKINAYYKAKASLGNIQNMQLMFENEISVKKIKINSLMNRSTMLDFDIDTTFQLNDYASTTFDSTFFNTNRSDLKAIDQDIQLTWLKQEVEKQSLNPQFGVKYDHMIGFGGMPMQFSLMGMMKIPLAKWSAKMNKANIESLKWKANALQSKKEMLVNEFSGMAYGIRSEIELKIKQLKLYEVNIIPALQNNYKTMQLGYEQNTEELFMLYDAWESLNMTQLEYLNVLNQVLSLQVSLERIIEVK